MLDKRVEEFDKVFVHDSWKELQRTLDKKLPVVKPTASPWIRLLIITQLLSVAGIALLLLDKSEIPYAQVTKESVQVKHVYHTQTIPQEPTTIIKYINVPAISNMNQSTDTNYDNFKNTTHESKSTYFGKSIPAIAVQKLNQNRYTLNKIYPARNILAHSILNLQYADTVKDSDDEKQLKNILNKKVDFRLGLLTSVTHDREFTGYGISSSVKINLNKKLGVGTGIGYNHLSREFIILPIVPNGGGLSDASVNKHSITEQLTFYRSLQDLKQIVVPFSLSYNLSKKFSVMTGVKFRYTFQSKVDKSLTRELTRTIKVIKDPEAIYFNNTNFGLGFGLSYTASSRIVFELDSEIGINSLVNNNQFVGNRLPSYDLNLLNFSTHYRF